MVQLLVIGVFLLSTLGSCRAKNATVEVVGLMRCSDCMKHQSSTTNSSLGEGLEVLMRCNSNETRTRGNGGVDEHGKFSVTLSADDEISISEDSGKPNGCYAKLQSRSGAPCRIEAPQTASLKIQTNSATTQQVIKFSPITCQSAFFWPFPNLTFHGTSPPEYTAPPAPVNPAPAPVQPPQPSYDPPAPSLPPPEIEAPSPPPTCQNPPSSPPRNAPIESPIIPPEQTPSPTPPPTTVIAPPPPSAGVSIPPRRRRPGPIPKAPPIPRLPLTPSVPRKYFNPPKSVSKPPRSV